MKIGIDARFWQETGVGRYIRNLVTELQKIDKKNEYVLFVRERDVENVKLQMTNVKWQIKIADIHWHSLKEQLEFPHILEKEKLDLMHFPYFSVPIRYNGKFVVTVHDLIIHHFATGEATTLPKPLYQLKVQAYKYIISQAAKKSEMVIAVSNATKDEIVDHLHVPEERIAVIYEGVDRKISTFKFPPFRDKQISNSQYGKYFLHVGNVYPHKNVKRLVEAFARAHLDDVQLLFVGKNDYFMQRLEEFVCKRKLEESVKFLGFVDDETLAILFKNALATIVPSLMEGFGLPVLEAMANESLVIASDIPSLKEIAKDAAIYIDPFNVEDISAKMRDIAGSDRKKFKSLRTNGKELAYDFSWEKMARQTLAIYESSTRL